MNTDDAATDHDADDDRPLEPGTLDIASGDAWRFLFAGDAIFTIVSAKTGTRYTYSLTRADFENKPPMWFLRLLAGPDNTANYTYMGRIDRDNGTILRTAKSAVSSTAPSWKAAQWALDRAGSQTPHPLLTIYHEGRCGACGRRLTVPDSIRTGLGPICAEKGGF